jgi:hypothetical protein
MATKPTASIVAGKTLKEIIWSPFVYAPYAAVAIANALMPVPAWMNIPALVAITAGHVWYWKRNWNFLYQKHEISSEVTYRNEQYSELANRLSSTAPTLINARYLGAIASAATAKAEIEQKIFSDGNITQRERELLETIELTITQMVQILDTAKSQNPPEEFIDALETLLELNKNFQRFTRPVFPTDEEHHTNIKSGLAESTKALKARMDEANRIRSIATETRQKIQ